MRRLFLALALTCAAGAAPAANYIEGVEYQRLAQPQPVETGDKIEVREVFWYGCPHCYALEPALEKWLKKLPAHARFVRMPGAQWHPTFEPHARAYYAFEALGVVGKLHPALFEAIHAKGRALGDEASIGFFVTEHGVKDADFRKAYGSFGVGVKVRNAKQYAERAAIRSVPTLVVDGRYITSATFAGTHEDALKVVEFLIQKAAAERKKPAAG
jgi:thiol:disulfide interchange protein DsbA